MIYEVPDEVFLPKMETIELEEFTKYSHHLKIPYIIELVRRPMS